MNPGDAILARLPELGPGPPKLRPALFLLPLPGPYQTFLVCGISTKLRPLLVDWDELIQPSDADFAGSGLHHTSVIRLSYLRALTPAQITGEIGLIDPARLARLRTRLADQVRP